MPDTAPLPFPLVTGPLSRCPRCGRGHLFQGVLKLRPACEHCGLDLAFADSGDGPAIFIIFSLGFAVMALASVTEALFHPAPHIHLMLWIATTIVLSLLLPRPFKAVLVAMQYRHGAREGRS